MHISSLIHSTFDLITTKHFTGTTMWKIYILWSAACDRNLCFIRPKKTSKHDSFMAMTRTDFGKGLTQWLCMRLYVCASASVPTGEAAGVGGGVPQKLAIHPSPHCWAPTWTVSRSGGGRRKVERCQHVFPVGAEMILMVCPLHPLCAHPFKHYQLKTDPGWAPLSEWACIFPV